MYKDQQLKKRSKKFWFVENESIFIVTKGDYVIMMIQEFVTNNAAIFLIVYRAYMIFKIIWYIYARYSLKTAEDAGEDFQSFQALNGSIGIGLLIISFIFPDAFLLINISLAINFCTYLFRFIYWNTIDEHMFNVGILSEFINYPYVMAIKAIFTILTLVIIN